MFEEVSTTDFCRKTYIVFKWSGTPKFLKERWRSSLL